MQRASAEHWIKTTRDLYAGLPARSDLRRLLK